MVGGCSGPQTTAMTRLSSMTSLPVFSSPAPTTCRCQIDGSQALSENGSHHDVMGHTMIRSRSQ